MAENLNPHVGVRARDFNQSLSAAVRDCHLAMTAWLLENGVTDSNQEDALGKRPLATALEKGFADVAELLRKHGARPGGSVERRREDGRRKVKPTHRLVL